MRVFLFKFQYEYNKLSISFFERRVDAGPDTSAGKSTQYVCKCITDGAEPEHTYVSVSHSLDDGAKANFPSRFDKLQSLS